MKNLSKEQLEFAVSYLHRLTTQRDITQTQLARLSSTVTQGTISKIFTRAQEPTEEVLKNLFAAVGVNLAEILNDSEALGHEILGYFATPLTGLSRNAGAAVERVVSRVKALLSGEEFSEPPTKLYWPGDHTHPARDPDFTANQVYLIDRSRASAYDFIIVLCASPSYGERWRLRFAHKAVKLCPHVLPKAEHFFNSARVLGMAWRSYNWRVRSMSGGTVISSRMDSTATPLLPTSANRSRAFCEA